MNAPQYPHRLAGTRLEWLQQPGETDAAYAKRQHESLIAFYVERGLVMPELTTDLACGVGLYDGNGNPCGSGWW